MNSAETQMNLAKRTIILGQREIKAERLEEAVAAWDMCLTSER